MNSFLDENGFDTLQLKKLGGWEYYTYSEFLDWGKQCIDAQFEEDLDLIKSICDMMDNKKLCFLDDDKVVEIRAVSFYFTRESKLCIRIE